jgi:hypothetical protein
LRKGVLELNMNGFDGTVPRLFWSQARGMARLGPVAS